MKIKVSYEALEAAQMCKAVRDVRYYLNGVAFLPDGRISSTNGHVAFVANGCEYSRKIKDTLIFEVQKKPVTKYHHAYIDDQSLLITYHDDADIQVGVGMVKFVDGKYPDIDKIFSKFTDKPCDKIGFNANYLNLIGKVCKLFNPKFLFVTINLNGSHDGAITKISGSTGEAKLMVMPTRVD